MEVRRSKGLVEPISEEHKIEWSSEADDYAPMQGSLVRLSGLPTETNQEMIKEVLLRLSTPVYFVDVYPDNTALIRLCHNNGAKLLLAKLKNGKVRIGKKSVLVSSLDEGEDDWSLPKTQDETHHFWKSLGTVKAKEHSFFSQEFYSRNVLERHNGRLSIPKSSTAVQQTSNVHSGCRPKSNYSNKTSTNEQKMSELFKTFPEGSAERSGRIQLDYVYGAVLEPRSPLLSTELTVRFAYVTSPTHFYVHVKDEVPTLLEPLMNRLNKLYDRSEPVSIERPEIGSFWVAKVKTMNLNWCRVLIFEVGTLKKGKVTVLSVDWGFLENVELSQLRPLVPDVMKTPCLALYFRLAGIFPLNQLEDSEDWSKAASKFLIKMVFSGEDFAALIHEEDQSVGQYSVLMWKGIGEEEITLNEMLVNLKLASSNIFPLEANAAADTDERKVNEEEQYLLDHERMVDYLTYLPVVATPTVGSRVSIKVCYVPDSFRFFCVLSTSSETLLAHQLDIQKEYNENHQLHRVTQNPLAADIVIARSPSNNIWYRARILQELKEDVFAVYFLDFGHERVVLKSDVCVLLTRFTHLPMQAVEMFLKGIDRKCHSVKGREELMNLVNGKNLEAHVVSENPELLVDLYDTSGGKQVDIAQELNRRRAIEEAKCRKYDPYRGVRFIPG